jgi:hypothetical protein
MTEINQFQENSAGVQAHLGITQSVIQRMASNSSSCKAWCITLVSAILVMVADKGHPQHALIGIIPTLLFYFLDSYYLALERSFRESYNSFIKKLHEGDVVATDLYAIKPSGDLRKIISCTLFSFSTWPFYLTLLIMAFIAKVFIISPS